MSNPKTSPVSGRIRLVAAALAVPFVLAAAPLRAGVAVPITQHMFVTSTSGSGDFGTNGTWAETEGSGNTGFAAADEICQERAAAAGLTGDGQVFRAWVSIGGTDAYCHVLGLTGTRATSCNGSEPDPEAGPWYRIDGVPFIDRLALLTNGTLGTASRDENGAFVSSVAWTGSNNDGSATASTCSGWASSSGFGSVGSTTSENFWGEVALDGTFGCGNNARLYCFQGTASVLPRAAWPEPAGLVFMTNGGVSSNVGGIAGADVLCQDVAADAHLPAASSFLAWLSDDSTDAKDRFAFGGPWYRVDGVRVATSLAVLLAGQLDSAISLGEDSGSSPNPLVIWTGTVGGGTKSANNCENWFSASSEFTGTAGSSDESGSFWTAANFPGLNDCNDGGRFYCFGQTIIVFWDGFESEDPLRWSTNVGYVP